MSSAFRGAIALALLGLASGSHSAQAQGTDYSTTVVDPFYTTVDSFTTTTDGSSPTFDRPLVTLGGISTSFSGLSTAQTAVAYATQNFTAAETGQYQVTTTVDSGYSTNASGTSNFIQFLYSPSFDPTAPLNNIVLADNPVGTTSSYGLNLTPADALTFVNGGRYNATNTAANAISTGTVTTDISEYHSGTLQTVSEADTLGQPGIASQTLTLTGGGPVTSFNSLDIVGLSQTYLGGLGATLTHDGITVNLFDRVNADPSNYYQGTSANFDGENYYFTDTGADLGEAAAAQEPPPGSFDDPGSVAGGIGNPYKSLDNLSAFDGLGLSGDWTLSVKDSDIGNDGSFLGFSFNASGNPASPVPEASTWISMGLGCLTLGGMMIAKRRRTATAS